ncbi:probable disease resistance protein At4g27220 [Beta vulgaris subsp. vulgaris]|uniref:probable disease resistance protein At4g27220 n=1 Tax=Beta vulgaris subsp. vulgaris TaxID=3555 RepID=UPI00203705F4|nr:probable disease resistance protein At4g27220 [Beta vulgaris subsp. vulgaris]
MEILIVVAAKAAEYIMDPIKHGVNIVFNPQSIIEETSKEYKQLEELHNKVKSRCQQARLDGDEVVEDVNQWLNNTTTISIEVEQWLQESFSETNTSGSCTAVCTNKWVWAHKQRKNAIGKRAKLVDMYEQGKNLSRISRLTPATGIQLLSGYGYIVFESVKWAFDDIMRALKRENQSMIGVYGMGGVGKTSLVRKAIAAAQEMQLYSKVVVSVVSQAPNVHKIQGELGDQLCLRYSRETELGRATQLKNRMKLEEKILVVLDDVWNKIDLTIIGIPNGDDHKGCKVLFTTRLERVCSLMGCKEPIKLSLLNDEDSWDLFKRHAGTMLSDPSSQLEVVAKEVTRECNSLPLALIVVASALRDKSQEEWEFALKKLQSSRLEEIQDIETAVYQRIELSYDFLRSESTKKCFLMCSLFPEDYEISIEMLTRYALGYGLFDQDTSIDSYMTAKTQVKIIISHLLACSLLLKPDSMSERFKMHDVVRDAAIWITSKGEEVFLVPIPSQNKWIMDPKLVNTMAISLLACPMNQHLLIPTECSKLKMLLLAQRVPLQNVRDTCFDAMTNLRVLDMTAIASYLLELALPSSLQLLRNLRTLYLRRWKLKGNLSIIGSLSSLEILSFAGSVLNELPMELVELSELKFLDLSACKSLAGFDSVVLSQLLLRVEGLNPPNNPISDIIYDED